ncbi:MULTISPECIES: ABC transporter permease [unclassified Streptomyces]|uniref:ABC transporter permease n=1 Tax=Streptomyces sp. NPDC005955 TaxID=3364738 RepID=UPI003675863D
MSTAPTPPPQQAPAAPAAAWQQPGGAYTSPIPITRTHLGHALTSEWTKIKSVRSTMWTLGTFLALVIGLGLLVAGQTSGDDYVDTPYTIPAFFGLVLGQICLITLGVLVISSEYGTGMIRTTLTASPARWRVLAAKFLIFFAVAFTVSVLATSFVGVVTAGMHGGSSSEPWFGTVFKGSLYVSLIGVLSVAVGAMLRHSAGAITTMLGAVLVPSIMPAFLMISPSTRDFGETMADYAAPNALAKIFMLDGDSTGTPQLVFLIVLTVAAVVGAFALLDRRDV